MPTAGVQTVNLPGLGNVQLIQAQPAPTATVQPQPILQTIPSGTAIQIICKFFFFNYLKIEIAIDYSFVRMYIEFDKFGFCSWWHDYNR